MESNEKARILMAAVDSAAAYGFDFQGWYKSQLNLGVMADKMDPETRILHMCCLGFENLLIFNHGFLRALIRRGWKGFLRSLVMEKVPLLYFAQHLVKMGILHE